MTSFHIAKNRITQVTVGSQTKNIFTGDFWLYWEEQIVNALEVTP